MWRLVAVGLLVFGLWGASQLLPSGDEEGQLSSITGIRAGGAPEATSEGPMAGKPGSKGAASPRTMAQQRPQAVDQPASERKAIATARAADQPVTGSLTPLATQDQASIVPADVSSDLVGKLQEQLRRVGCYKGPVDGKWSSATRRAVARFNDRIRLQAVVDTPQPGWLPALRSFAERACGTPCPGGMEPDAQGLCMVKATVVAALPEARTAAPLANNDVVASTSAPLPLSAPGRVADAGKLRAKTGDAIIAAQNAGPAAANSRTTTSGPIAPPPGVGLAKPDQVAALDPAITVQPVPTGASVAATAGRASSDAAAKPPGLPLPVARNDVQSIGHAGRALDTADTPAVDGTAIAAPVKDAALKVASADAQPSESVLPTIVKPAPAQAAAASVQPHKHKRARRSYSITVETQVASGADLAQRHRHRSGSYFSSYGFSGSGGPADGELTIVLSKR